MKLFCFFGLHSWRFWEQWTPSIDAPIVTRYQFTATCARCGKAEITDLHFDPATGVEV